jgi:hypothetical protein
MPGTCSSRLAPEIPRTHLTRGNMSGGGVVSQARRRTCHVAEQGLVELAVGVLLE